MATYGPASAGVSQSTMRGWLDQAVAYAEARFGPRDARFTLYGPFPDAIGPICNYCPPGADPPFATVFVSELSTRDQFCALFECAHEAVHVLTPRPGRGQASLFEEGLATWASVSYMWITQLRDMRPVLGPRYREALALVEPLLGDANPRVPPPTNQEEAFRLWQTQMPQRRAPVPSVLNLRERVAAISDATADDLQAVWPELDRATAERLAAPAGEMRPVRTTSAAAVPPPASAGTPNAFAPTLVQAKGRGFPR